MFWNLQDTMVIEWDMQATLVIGWDMQPGWGRAGRGKTLLLLWHVVAIPVGF